MAETTLPSVRGHNKLSLFTLLLLSASGSGALVGFFLGLAMAPIPATNSSVVVSLLVLALGADLVNLMIGRPQPFTLGRQVPREWRDLFDPRLVAVLYGARIGIGPSTILSTWMWWGGSLGAGLLGVWTSVLFGATFGAVRIVSTGLIAGRADRVGHQETFGKLRQARKAGWGGLNLAAGLGCLVFVLGACTSQDTASNSAPTPDQVDQATLLPDSSSTSQSVEAPSVTALPDPQTPSSVIDAIPLNDPSTPDPNPMSPDDLAASLLTEVPQFDRLIEPEADRHLDLAAATSSQPDPTEEGPLLETRGFHGGWTRAFRNDTQDVIIATVYDFRNSSEAAYYREDGLITLGGYGAEFFEVPQLPEARGFRTESSDEIGPLITWGLTFTHENQWYLMYLLGDPQTATVEVLIEATTAQYQHLGLPMAEPAP